MCGIIGAVIKTPSADDLELVKNVFRESKIRGMHATGLSYVKDDKLHTIKAPKPADEFVSSLDFSNFINEDGNLYMIGHCRYSTSDLEYNQPMESDNLSIVHNGVVSQELPQNWSDLYGFDCKTKNDSELILRVAEEGEEPLRHWADASISVCELHKDKTFRFYRNGQRPIHAISLNDGFIVASTEDIFRRAGVNKVVDLNFNTVYTLKEFELTDIYIPTNAKDLQPA
jgi:glutamine phosphoribosylpyrophosphate amidotransferase